MTRKNCYGIYRVMVIIVCVVYILKELVIILYYLSDYHKYITSYDINHEAQIMHHLNKNSSLTPITSLVFLKTHKTAGSTVSRIFFRELCEFNTGTNCFIPPLQHAGRIWDLENANDRSYVMSNSPYDVWLHHFKVSKFFFSEVVPNSQAVISILRRPAHRFVSAWNWYNHSARLHTSLKSFIIHQVLSSSPGQCRFPPLLNSFVVNRMFRLKFRTCLDATSEELTSSSGLLSALTSWWNRLNQYKKKGRISFSAAGSSRPTELKITSSAQFRVSNFEGLLKEIVKGRLFVIVSERLDESLVLLADYLKWDISRMLYHSHKIASRGESTAYETLDSDLMAELDRCQPYDSVLYSVASRVLGSRIQLYNSRHQDPTAFNRTLARFKTGQRNIHKLCSSFRDKTDYYQHSNGSFFEFAELYCSSLVADNREGISRYHELNRSRMNTSDVLQKFMLHVQVE